MDGFVELWSEIESGRWDLRRRISAVTSEGDSIVVNCREKSMGCSILKSLH